MLCPRFSRGECVGKAVLFHEYFYTQFFVLKVWLTFFRACAWVVAKRFLLEVGQASHRYAELAVRTIATILTLSHGSKSWKSIFLCVASEYFYLTCCSTCRLSPQGRGDVNATDVLCVLNEMDTSFSRLTQNAAAFEIPFAHTLPLRLRIKRLPKVWSICACHIWTLLCWLSPRCTLQRVPAFRECGDTALPHLPKFLPALPDAHTFMRTAGEDTDVPSDQEVS